MHIDYRSDISSCFKNAAFVFQISPSNQCLVAIEIITPARPYIISATFTIVELHVCRLKHNPATL